MMLNGRIMIVSDRPHVAAELEPIVRAASHLALTVPDAREALRSLEQGLVPDLIISDLGSGAASDRAEYLSRFHHINRAGAHLVILDEDAPAPPPGPGTTAEVPLRRPFREDEVQWAIESAVGRIAREVVALRGQMCREMEEMRHGLRELRRDVVTALAGTIAARDPYMHGHSVRVAALACRVAEAMGVAPADVELLEFACLLHEIGKVVVPLDLLHKTGPLTPDELEQIRAHAAAGARILEGVGSLKAAARVIEHHTLPYAELHHTLDVESTEFLLAGILHAADAYDAMTSARAYRAAMDRGYCTRTLEAGSGTRFHPAVSEMLLRITA
jgi:putative nucleotidyltransferase with HDIG domain